jgi:hypothetical protein
MAHNLNIINGRASLFVTSATWHGLESEVSQISTSDEVIKLAGLDYEVEKVKVQACIEEDCKEIPGKWATIRTDNNTPLGIVGDRYHILQNREAFKFIDDITGKKEAIFHSAGALGKGERVWMTVKLPEQCVIGIDDVIEHYFFLTNSHDGSKAVEVAFSQTMIVCENTLRLALSNSKRKRGIRHTSSVMSSLNTATDLMGITRLKIQEMQEVYTAMTKVQITDKELRRFIELAMKPEVELIGEDEYSKRFSNQVDRVLEYSLSDDTQIIDSRKGNLYGALNGITGYYNNVVEYDSGADKLNNIMYGIGNKNSQRALDLAMNVLSNAVQLS